MLLIPSNHLGAGSCSFSATPHTVSQSVEALLDSDPQDRSRVASRATFLGCDKLPSPTSDVSGGEQTSQGPAGQVLGATQTKIREPRREGMERKNTGSGGYS